MSTIRFDTRFPGYEVLSELGRSNARILKARHLATGDLVAIKHFALNTDDETLRRFQRESSIMTSIAHPNVVKVREVQLEAELPYIVMELIEGGSLKQLIAGQNRIDISTTIRLGLQMASAFKAIHPQGIVHRDVKPENILYRPLPSGELHFLLTDFGIARLHEQSNTLTGQSLMTYEYASPEQFNDPRGVGPATDYYSLGVVLYECLHGSVPFALDDQSGIVTFMNKVLTEAPPALTLTSENPTLDLFRELLEGLLKKKASERLNDPDELTWLLKQSELNFLRTNRTSSKTAPPASVIDSGKTRPKPEVPEAVRPESGPLKPEPASPARPNPSRKPWVLAVLVLVVLAVGAGLYYANTGSIPKPIANVLPRNDTTAALAPAQQTDEETAAVEEDTMNLYRAKQAKRREQIREQVAAAGRTLSVDVLGLKVGFFGGIKQARIQLENPSPFPFPAVAVQISYFKDQGGLYKTEKIFFINVPPHSSPVRSAPDSDRGTRISCKILKYDLPKNLDSLMRVIPAAIDSTTNE
ncbi:serine/threonine protein kinase [Larkinella rosea]|uniref:Serine/threonine protein kinase n=1 Tax=Larkinella rosea TaxID=2025312 RepID=A0A3P1BG35_9BACT|nr:serine/threonine-protein kinase [Larkinella rosea]RRB00049.1 serine/threonine protein kinase [Larkinella rosea]